MLEVKKYYVNKLAPFNGDNLVHREDCRHLPLIEHCMPLGEFTHCEPAVIIAKKVYRQVSGCKECAPNCYAHFIFN